MPLSDTAVRNAKPRTKPFKLSDGGGLHLLVPPHGSKLWRLAYRFGCKQKTLALGIYPAVTLAEARAKRDAARKLLGSGKDPSVLKRAQKHSQRITFKAIADELLAKHAREGRARRTLDKTTWLLGLATPGIGDRPIQEITAPELLTVLRKVEAKGRYESARRLRSTCGMVFRYAIATGRADRDPSADLRGALTVPQVTHRAAITDPAEIGALLRAIEGYTGHFGTRLALKLLALTFVRPGEIRHGEWSEFDLESAEWRIPAAKMKMRRPHRVPLSRQALAILIELAPLTGAGRWLFPSIRTETRPMSENTLNAALRRLGYATGEMCSHGFRALASTRLNEMGKWTPDAIERQLAHVESNAVRRAYTHTAEYWQERVTMMQDWADYLHALRDRTSDILLRTARHLPSKTDEQEKDSMRIDRSESSALRSASDLRTDYPVIKTSVS
jgi:integrase